jgi:hypothetical protein
MVIVTLSIHRRKSKLTVLLHRIAEARVLPVPHLWALPQSRSGDSAQLWSNRDFFHSGESSPSSGWFSIGKSAWIFQASSLDPVCAHQAELIHAFRPLQLAAEHLHRERFQGNLHNRPCNESCTSFAKTGDLQY